MTTIQEARGNLATRFRPAGSDFRTGEAGAAIWFVNKPGTADWGVYRSQGLTAVRAIQAALVAGADGKWGPETNRKLRERMSAMGMDPSIVRDGVVTREMLEAGLAIADTRAMAEAVGDINPTRIRAMVYVPDAAILPLWNTKPTNDAPNASQITRSELDPATGAATSSQTVGGSTPAARWRRPDGSSVLYTGFDGKGDADSNLIVVFRTAAGQTRTAILGPVGQLVEERDATPQEAAGQVPNARPAPTSQADPGTVSAPRVATDPTAGAGQTTGTAPALQNLAPPPPPPSAPETWWTRNQRAVIVGGGVLVVGGVILALVMSSRRQAPQFYYPPPPMLPPPQPMPPAVPNGRQNPKNSGRVLGV